MDNDPTVSLQVKPGWGRSLRERAGLARPIREVPGTASSLGLQGAREWWTAFWYEGREWVRRPRWWT